MARKTLAIGAGGVAITLLALGLMVGDRSAFAHAGYETSSPADGEVLAEPPERVDAYFGQEMSRSNGLPTMIVVNAAGDVITEDATLDDADRKHLSVEMPPALPDGRYTVIWHTLSDEDAEEAQGAFHYYVGDGPSATAGPNETPDATATPGPTAAPGDDANDDGGVPLWAMIAGIVAGLVIGGGAGVALGRRAAG